MRSIVGSSSPKSLTSTGSGEPSRSPIMSCRIWGNSTITPGALCSICERRSLITSLVPRCRSERGFIFTRMSPRFCSVTKRPNSAPVRRENDAISGIFLMRSSKLRTILSVSARDVVDYWTPPGTSLVGLGKGRSGRGPIVHNEATFIHIGQESGFQARVQQNTKRDHRNRGTNNPPAMHQRPTHPALILSKHRVDESVGGRLMGASGKKTFGEQRNQCDGKNQREKNRGAQRQTERLEELADDSSEQPERQKNDERSGGRADDRAQELERALLRGQLR